MHFIKFKNHRKSQSGFGLVELLVSISIIAVVSSVVLIRNNAFNGAVLLRDQTYEIAFALKQAQLMAVSGTQENTNDSKQFGVYFNKGNTSNQQYLTFRDDSNNGTLSGRYDANGTDPDDVTIGSLGHIDRRFKIRDFKDGNRSSINSNELSVTFARPNFDAIFKNGNGDVLIGPIYIDISQVGKDDDDDTYGAVRRIQITPAGQISVVTY